MNLIFAYDLKEESNSVMQDINIQRESGSNIDANIIEIYIKNKNIEDVEFYNHSIPRNNAYNVNILLYRFLSTIGMNSISTKSARN